MKKALFIGGTGTISAAIVRRLVNELGWQVWLLNRGNRPDAVPSSRICSRVSSSSNSWVNILIKRSQSSLSERSGDAIYSLKYSFSAILL